MRPKVHTLHTSNVDATAVGGNCDAVESQACVLLKNSGPGGYILKYYRSAEVDSSQTFQLVKSDAANEVPTVRHSVR